MESIAVAFARVLRGAGLAVPTSTVLAFTEALGVLGITDRHDVYWAGRATLVRKPEDVTVFDQAFAVFWDGASGLDGGGSSRTHEGRAATLKGCTASSRRRAMRIRSTHFNRRRHDGNHLIDDS